MKLRIKGNSIRLRLLRSEVELFAADGKISDEIRFGTHASSSLRYSLSASAAAKEISTKFIDHEISIIVPEVLAHQWATSERVGIESIQKTNGNGGLSVLIEKDFACLERPDDPDSEDAYENPKWCFEKG